MPTMVFENQPDSFVASIYAMSSSPTGLYAATEQVERWIAQMPSDRKPMYYFPPAGYESSPSPSVSDAFPLNMSNSPSSSHMHCLPDAHQLYQVQIFLHCP